MDELNSRPTAGEARAAAFKKTGAAVVTPTMARRILRRDETGLWADFPNQNGDRSKGPVPLSFLLELDPEVCAALSEGCVMHCLKNIKSADRRYDMGSRLRRGLMNYLADPHVATPTLAELDEPFLQRFKAWLDDDKRDGFLANSASRAELLSAVQQSLGQLLSSREWKPRLSPKLHLITKPYQKITRDIEHTPTLNEPDFEKLYAGAAIDIAAVTELRIAQLDAMDRLDGKSLALWEAGLSPEACAAWLIARCGDAIVPSYYDMGRNDARYQRAVSAAVHEQAERILYPDIDEVAPMILVVCAFFALNPSIAFKLRNGNRDYRIENFGALRRLRMYPNKRRATLRQRNIVTVTDHPDNPGRILEYLERRTLWMRGARPDLADRAFLRFSFEKRTVVAFTTSDEAWKLAVGRFAARHRMDEFTLDQLRPTTLDLVHELSGGNIIAMQGVATHTTAQTTYTYYTSDAQRRRNRERLGEMLMQMERWTAMGGKIRPDDRPPGLGEHAAATPGFSCIDPKDSPIPGERRGELCTAYGRCPECPLALVDPASPRSLAYLIMLNKRITEAEADAVDPVAWHMRWGPVREELVTYWLRGWSPDLLEKARAIPIPELPPVE